jgi:uncharacterized membrane protein
MERFGVREIAAIGIMAALTTIATMTLTIPIPATQGYFNLGDAIVIISALVFGPIVGGVAGGVGSALADLLGGWYTWVPFTLIIKGLEGAVAGYIGGRQQTNYIKSVIAWLIGGSIMVIGYFLVQVMLYGLPAAMVEIPFNMGQMISSGIIGIPISIIIRRRLRL